MSEKEIKALRHLEIVSDIDHLTEISIIYAIQKYKTIKEWAWIKHDKDVQEDGTPKNPHYHIYLNFGVPQDIELVASWFDLKPNFVRRIMGRKKDMLKYLIHRNAPTKFQYDVKDVHTNIDFEAEITDHSIIGDFKNYSYAKQIQYVAEIPDSKTRLRLYKDLKLEWALYCEKLTTEGNRNMEVWFIDGNKGTGKTSFAKWWCENRGLDYALSSSSNDPLQDYKGQKVLIMDDLRDDAFKLSDLLKLLDNHTSSSTRSRYNNKVFNGDLIIITTTRPLSQWYQGENVRHEDKGQLYRRIKSYIHFEKDNFYTYPGVNEDTGEPLGTPTEIKNIISVMYLPEHDQQDILGQQLKMIVSSPQVQKMIQERLKEKAKK